MKKLLVAAGLLALWSCADVDLQEETTKNNSRASSLNLYDFDESQIHGGYDEDGHNHDALQDAIDYVAAHPELYDGLEIGALDCYVRVAGNNGLSLPSNFALVMGDNTHLRISPYNTATGGYSLIQISYGNDYGPTYPDNILITGGHLYGDRKEHPGTSLQGHVIRMWTCTNVDIDGVEIADANADGIAISGSEINVPGAQNYTPPSNINIMNCTIRDSRRCNITIADGHHIDLGYNKFYDAGQYMTKTDGTQSVPANPRCSLNIEGDRAWQGSTLHYYSHPQQITVHDNEESGSFAHAYLVGLGSYVDIKNNISQRGVGYAWGDNINIEGNTINGNGGHGLFGGAPGFVTTVHDNMFRGNTVKDCSIGLVLYSNDTQVRENTIEECGVGIQFLSLRRISIEDNVIKSYLTGCRGIQQENSPSHPDYYFAEDVTIQGNVFLLMGGPTSRSFFINGTNSMPAYDGYNFNIYGNNITTEGSFRLGGTKSFNIENNLISSKTGIWLTAGAKKTLIKGNTIITDPTAYSHPYDKSNAININGCTEHDNLITENDITNVTTDPNAHILQADNCADFKFTSNKIHQKTLKVIDIKTSCSGLFIENNVGDIGTCTESPYFIYAPTCPGITCSGNLATQGPTTRQNVNGVGPWGCP